MLEFQNVSFSYVKGKTVLNDLSFSLGEGEILAVMGRSGGGKSTLLSLAGGLLKPSAGIILRKAERPAFCFQEPRLFPWLNVRENLAAVLPKSPENEGRIAEMLSDVGLADAGELYPDELSGGMKIRVSLARALLWGGDLFLFDEPFSALDEETKARLIPFARERVRAAGASAILVTHVKEDAERFADRILVLPE